MNISKKDFKFINREVSWMQFNERVLQEAADPNTPLIERLKFLGIFSNNLDEFFRVRVATINRIVELNKKKIIPYSFDPEKVIKEVYEFDEKLHNIFATVYQNIITSLNNKGICIVNEQQLNEKQGEYVKKFFHEKVRSNLFPIMLEQKKHDTVLKDKSIYLAIHLSKIKYPLKNNYAIIKIPTSQMSRFVLLPDKNNKKQIIILDDVIRYCLSDIFSMFDYEIFKAYTFKFTRDAELDLDNDVSKSFMEIMSESIQQRKIGVPVRFVFDKNIPEPLLKLLTKKLQITKKDQLHSSGRYHNFKDFMAFPKIGEKEFRYPKVPPIPHKDLHKAKSIFAVLRQKDIMLHYPYHSFQYIIDLLREASIDPEVISIKISIYRLAKNSSIINALINAARNGKIVTAFMELQARFDEKANIYWSEKLQEEGVRIIHGTPGLKVHSKLFLIKRREGKRNFNYYAHIGTGNFNEETAEIYADNSLLTCKKNISLEVDKVFNLFENPYKPVRFQNLVVSPFSQRKFFIKMINNEIQNVKNGHKGKIIVKLNNLVDKTIAKKIYTASQNGVEVKLIIRGICILIAGIPGVSENLDAISIVDKYLEHSRIFYFYNNGNEKIFISSADWMIRNFDNRIEVTTPIYDKSIQKELMEMLKIQLKDNTKARLLKYENINKYKTSKQKQIRSQEEFYNYLKTIYENK